ncbi:MAG TPA: SUMF1/EgtB/PvdO family nonheme iron enzyme [Polyangiaceae bacterium]|nr:SUMF1/EgtB/PvdO family nonheme iron enzyme [Polyangiaceae bacterium]
MRKIRLTRINYAVAAAVTALASIALSVRFAQSQRSEPVRCPPGLAIQDARCCGVGQGLTSSGQCSGVASACASEMVRDDSGMCVLPDARISLDGGVTHLGASDWEGPEQALPEARVQPFALDRAEVTVARFRSCSAARLCPKLPDDSEPGRPVRNLSPSEASAFCAYVGGRLPSADEWLFAAAGSAGRRYPWGNTGLVCRRASFGLVSGPCARSGSGPDLAGARPDGATPEGILDLSGNVAEWTVERDGSFAARGGSYRSELSADLKTWSVEPRKTRAPYVGFRCAYPLSPTQ